VEHHPARGEDGGERQADREDGEAGELEPDGRSPPERQRREEPGREADHRDGEREPDHGSNR
jgi:hypothetical protein